MENQELYYDILQKKYNILKKNLIIIEQTEEKNNEFKNTIIELDKMEQDKFKKDLDIKKELTTNLEDEYKRLCDYINLLEERNRRRELMLTDFNNIVKDNINELEEIEDYDNIEFYKERLEDINEYLTNDKKYEKYIEEKEEYIKILNEYELKCNSLKNIINDFELNLLIKLKNIISSNSIYEKLDFNNVDESIDTYSELLNEKEKELVTYLNSYNVLVESDIVNEEKEEYKKFIIEEKDSYLDLLEKKYILLIYKYINSNNLEETLKVYEERLDKLSIYELSGNSDLKEVFEIINNFILKKEKLNEIELTIESIKNNIDQVNLKIYEITKELNKVNILNLLKEFCIEKEYIVNNNIESTSEDIKFDENFSNDDEIIVEEDKMISEVDNKEEIFDILPNIDFDNNVGIENVINNFSEDLPNNIDIIEEKDNLNNDEEINYLDNEIFEEEKVADNIEISEDDEFLNKIETMDNNVESNIEINEINNNISENIEYKDNAIVEVKDINSMLLIDEIQQKALNIMKSVCESVI